MGNKKRKIIRINLATERNVEKLKEVIEALTEEKEYLQKEIEELKKKSKIVMPQVSPHQEQK